MSAAARSLPSLRSRVSCPTALLVIAPNAAVARWCAQPINLGHPGFVLHPLVAGPQAIPVITDKQVARRDPELAVLSAMAHGHQKVGQVIAKTVMAAVRDLDAERINLYVDLTLSAVGEAARRALEALMQSGNYEYQSKFIRKHVAQLEQRSQEGRKKGRQEGRHEGELAALLEVLDARGLKVSAAVRKQILACTDPLQLKRWLRKAATAESAQELFASEPAPKPSARKAVKAGRSLKASKPRSKR